MTIAERFQEIAKEVSADIHFLIADDLWLNQLADEKDLLTKDIIAMDDVFTSQGTYDGAGSVFETLPLRFQVVTGDDLDNNPDQTFEIVERMRVHARRFALRLSQDTELRSQAVNIDKFTLTTIKKKYDATLSGVELRINFPMRPDFDQCFET